MRPFGAYLLPRFHGGEVAVSTQSIDTAGYPTHGPRAAWNLGHALGLDGLTSLVPLLVGLALCGVWLAWTVRRSRATA